MAIRLLFELNSQRVYNCSTIKAHKKYCSTVGWQPKLPRSGSFGLGSICSALAQNKPTQVVRAIKHKGKMGSRGNSGGLYKIGPLWITGLDKNFLVW